MIGFLLRLLRTLFIAVLGAAVAAKFLLESNAKPDTEEIDLVNIFGGANLVSSASPFYGGKITNVFGGTVLDLRKATPAPTGVYVDALVVLGGLQVIVPHGWRVAFEATLLAAGYDDSTQPTLEPDSPLVRIGGVVLAGGVSATSRSQIEAVI